jgi:hypothetical protein
MASNTQVKFKTDAARVAKLSSTDTSMMGQLSVSVVNDAHLSNNSKANKPQPQHTPKANPRLIHSKNQ